MPANTPPPIRPGAPQERVLLTTAVFGLVLAVVLLGGHTVISHQLRLGPQTFNLTWGLAGLIYAGMFTGVVFVLQHQFVRELKTVGAQMNRHEQRLATVWEGSEDALISLDADGRIVETNKAGVRLLGAAKGDALLGRTLVSFAAESRRDALDALCKRSSKAGITVDVPFSGLDGQLRWGHVGMYRLSSDDGAAWLALIADTTSHKATEQLLRRCQWQIAVLEELNHLLGRCHSQDVLFQAVCRLLVERGHSQLAWIGVVPQGGQRIDPIARWGSDDGCVQRMSQIAAAGGETMPTARAVASGGLAVCNDVRTDPGAAAWREDALAHGILAIASLPLRNRQADWWVLTICSGTAEAFDEAETALLHSLAQAVGFALDVLAEREHPGDVHRDDAPAWQAAAMAQIVDGAVTLDPSGHVTGLNQWAQTWTGWTPDDAKGRSVEEVVVLSAPGALGGVRALLRQVLPGAGPLAFAAHTVLIDRAGRRHAVDGTLVPLSDGAGGPSGFVVVFSPRRPTHAPLAAPALPEQVNHGPDHD